jgi:hypothetical protein
MSVRSETAQSARMLQILYISIKHFGLRAFVFVKFAAGEEFGILCGHIVELPFWLHVVY